MRAEINMVEESALSVKDIKHFLNKSFEDFSNDTRGGDYKVDHYFFDKRAQVYHHAGLTKPL